mgnify:CR=1 FL=1
MSSVLTDRDTIKENVCTEIVNKKLIAFSSGLITDVNKQ